MCVRMRVRCRGNGLGQLRFSLHFGGNGMRNVCNVVRPVEVPGDGSSQAHALPQADACTAISLRQQRLHIGIRNGNSAFSTAATLQASICIAGIEDNEE